MNNQLRVWLLGGALAALTALAVQGCGGDSGKKTLLPPPGDAGDGGALNGEAGESSGGGVAGNLGAAGEGGAAGASEAGSAGDDGSAGEAGSAGSGGTSPWHLWVFDRTSLHLYGYGESQLQVTNGDPAEIDITLADLPTLNNTHIVFDANGDLWVSELSAYRFPAAQLKGSGTAHVAAVLSNIGGNYGRIAFDPAGNLWRSSYTSPPLTRFDAADVATLSTTKTTLVPKFTSTAASDYPLVFDEAGNLYTGFYATQGATTGPNFFGRYAATQLVGTGATIDPPALSILPRYAATALLRSVKGDFVLADSSATITRYSKAQLALNGENTALTPDATFSVTIAGAVPSWKRLATDADGNLYLAEGGPRVIKLASADVAQKGTFAVAPAMTLRARSEDVNAAFQAITVH